ncbi:MAG TPA: helix-turn-helix transcriptional regulator [Planktothrix sp.]
MPPKSKRPKKEISDEQFLLNLGETIRLRRQALGLSQEDTASRAGVHRTYLSDIERGTRNITVGMLAQVAAALEVTLAYLTKAAEPDD